MRYDTILFDLDGTLIDSVPDLADAVNAMLTQLHRRTFPEATVRNWVGNGAQMLVKRALLGRRDVGKQEIDPALFEAALQYFFEAYGRCVTRRTRPYTGVEETLAWLHSKKYKMAIVTNKPERFTPPILKAFDIARYFDVIIGGDTLRVKKPDPAPLQEALTRLGAGKEQAVMVGDSKNDILAAKALGIASIAVSYGYNYDEPITRYRPDHVIDRFTALKECLA